MQKKKDFLIRRQIQRREEQLIKKNERLIAAAEHQNEYRLYEDFLSHRRQEDDQRRKTILQAHVEQKRREADPPSSHDYYFAAARRRHRLKRKASMTSFVSFDDEISFGGSTFDLFSTASGKKPSKIFFSEEKISSTFCFSFSSNAETKQHGFRSSFVEFDGVDGGLAFEDEPSGEHLQHQRALRFVHLVEFQSDDADRASNATRSVVRRKSDEHQFTQSENVVEPIEFAARRRLRPSRRFATDQFVVLVGRFASCSKSNSSLDEIK